MTDVSSGRRLLNATAVMASGTMVSRVLGFVRAIMIAFVLGNSGVQVDVFAFAMTVPNSLYMLLAGGTLNNVLVPQIVRAVLHDKDQGKAFINRIMTAFLLALAVLTVVLTFAVPWVMSLYTASSWREPAMAAHWETLLLMSYVTMPQLFFFGVFFLIGQVLNARDKFGPMMWAPIVNNVVSIAVLASYIGIWGSTVAAGTPFTTGQVLLLGIGSTIGIAAQTLVLLPYLKKVGFSYRPRFDLKGTGLGRTFHVAKWMVGYVALTSLAQVVVSNLASTAAPLNPDGGGGGWNAYQQAYLIWILPHSLLTVSLATAMLPAASRAAVAGNLAGVTAETTRALRLATTFLVPASLGFLALAGPLARLIFGNGSGADDYHVVSWALIAFAIGLVPYTIQYLYLRAFYALDNTRTPFLLQIAISGANALLAVVLVVAIVDPGTVAARLALSYSLAYVLGLWLTHRALAAKIPGLPGRATLQHLGRLLVASLPAALIAFGVATGFSAWFSGLGWQLLGLALAAGLAVLAFFFTAKRMGIPEASQLIGILRRRPAADEVPLADEAPLAVEELVAAEASVPISPLPVGGEAATELVNPDPDGVGVFVQVDAAPVAPEAALDFPEPGVGTPSEPEDEPTNLIDVGRMLAGRYQLAELLASRAGHETWRADDTVLSRPVLIHLLAEGDPRGAEVLELARRAALATDSRFLRVLDVVAASPGEHGVYLVYEYAPGQTLQRVLASGPLTGSETAWVVREISDAITTLHTAGLTHRHLSPATVLITSTGHVKIIGLLVDEALAEPVVASPGGEQDDVRALGNLLYACLVARWPGGDRYGLRSAPVEGGVLLLPSQVRGGVAHPVDAVVDRILSPHPRQGASRLATAADVTTELSLVLGPSSATADLRARLGRGDSLALPVSAVAPPVPTPAHPRYEVSERIEGEEFSGDLTQPFVRMDDTPPPFTPVPPPAPGVPESAQAIAQQIVARKRTRTRLVLGFVAVLLVTGLVALAALWPKSTPVATPPSTSPRAPVKVAVQHAGDFDPRKDGGSGQENTRAVGLAIDGNPATAWTTERYKTKPTFGGLKPGVGLVLDLGSQVSVQFVKVTLQGGPTAIEVRVPLERGDAAPMESETEWRKLAGATSASGTFSLGVAEPVKTRFVLVYLTSLPEVEDGYYRGAIAELEVLG